MTKVAPGAAVDADWMGNDPRPILPSLAPFSRVGPAANGPRSAQKPRWWGPEGLPDGLAGVEIGPHTRKGPGERLLRARLSPLPAPASPVRSPLHLVAGAGVLEDGRVDDAG